jgi:hypothetical protein
MHAKGSKMSFDEIQLEADYSLAGGAAIGQDP